MELLFSITKNIKTNHHSSPTLSRAVLLREDVRWTRGRGDVGVSALAGWKDVQSQVSVYLGYRAPAMWIFSRRKPIGDFLVA